MNKCNLLQILKSTTGSHQGVITHIKNDNALVKWVSKNDILAYATFTFDYPLTYIKTFDLITDIFT